MLKLRFKTKVQDGKAVVPDFKSSHVHGPEHFNAISLAIELRRAYRNDPAKRPPKVLDLSNLPHNVTVVKTGFLTEFEVTV